LKLIEIATFVELAFHLTYLTDAAAQPALASSPKMITVLRKRMGESKDGEPISEDGLQARVLRLNLNSIFPPLWQIPPL
jgi:hypothetical protein